MENEILKELYFDPEKGSLLFKEVRYLLVRPETLIAFQKGIEQVMGERASAILFQSGFEGGALSSKRYRETFHLSDKEIIHFMIAMGTQIGWGKFELERFDLSQKRLLVHVRNSPFAEAYGTSASSVCHFIRGVIGGMASVLFETGGEVREASCLAKGDEYCTFESMW